MEFVKYQDHMMNEWDDFVFSHPEGRYCHTIGFKRAVETTYGYQSEYRTLRDSSGNIVGVFPSFVVKGIFGTTKVISQPFQEYGGFLVDSKSVLEPQAVCEALDQLLNGTGSKYIEVRGGTDHGLHSFATIFLRRQLSSYATLPLQDIDTLWNSRINYSVRKAVKKARSANLVCYHDITREAIERRFYPLYLLAMKKFGTPPHPVEFFHNLATHLQSSMKLFHVDIEGRTIAALMGFVSGQRLHITNTVSNPSFLQLRPNDLAHWEMIRWASENHLRTFDFGLVRYAGQDQFKRKWGCETHDYAYWYYPKTAQSQRLRTYSDPGILNWLWSRAVPMAIAAKAGKYIRAYLGR